MLDPPRVVQNTEVRILDLDAWPSHLGKVGDDSSRGLELL